MKNKQKIVCMELGYYHPSQANWNYHIFLIIDATGARLYRATFGGERRTLYDKQHKTKIEFLTAGRGTGVEYKWRDIKDLPEIEYYNGINWSGK